MLNSSVAQLDEFIRSQKEKLNIDKMNYMNSMQNDNQMVSKPGIHRLSFTDRSKISHLNNQRLFCHFQFF